MVECSQRGLLLQSEASLPIIDRLFDHGVDASRPVETFRCVEGLSAPPALGNSCWGYRLTYGRPPLDCRTQDNRVCVVAIPKAEPGEHWQRLFRGDSDGARCLQPPYTLTGAAPVLLPAPVALTLPRR